MANENPRSNTNPPTTNPPAPEAKKAKKDSGYVAVHELPYNDELVGRTSIRPGSVIPNGVFKEEQLKALLKKKAIKTAKQAAADEADSE